jgi:hypothetical protein
MAWRGYVEFAGRLVETRGEVGFPCQFGGVAEEPVAAAGDGGFDLGDAGDGTLHVSEASSAPAQLAGQGGAFLLEPCQVALLGADSVLGLVDGVLVGASEPAGSGQRLEAALGVGEALAVPCDGGVDPGDFRWARLSSRRLRTSVSVV